MYATEESVKHYLNVFSPPSRQQRGGAIGNDRTLQYYVPSVRRQRGAGLGLLFKNLFSHIVPFAKKYLLPAAKQYVLPQVKEMGKNVASDLLSGNKTFKESFKQHGKAAFKKGAEQVVNDQLGSGVHARRTNKRKRKAKIGIIKKQKVFPTVNYNFEKNN